MPILVRNILLGLDEPEERLAELLARRLRLPSKAIRHYAVVRRSIDARKKDIRFSYQVEVAIEGSRRAERAQWKRIQSQDITWLEPIETPTPRCRFASPPGRREAQPTNCAPPMMELGAAFRR